jgi:hypothetical protein
MYHSILYYSVLFCSVLFCSVLFCSVLFRSVLFCSVLFRSVPFCSVPFRSVPFLSVPFRSVPFYSFLFCSILFILYIPVYPKIWSVSYLIFPKYLNSLFQKLEFFLPCLLRSHLCVPLCRKLCQDSKNLSHMLLIIHKLQRMAWSSAEELNNLCRKCANSFSKTCRGTRLRFNSYFSIILPSSDDFTFIKLVYWKQPWKSVITCMLVTKLAQRLAL